jgi:hypothetical protein
VLRRFLLLVFTEWQLGEQRIYVTLWIGDESTNQLEGLAFAVIYFVNLFAIERENLCSGKRQLNRGMRGYDELDVLVSSHQIFEEN